MIDAAPDDEASSLGAMATGITRRQFVSSPPAISGGSSIVSACSQSSDAEGYEAVAGRTWRLGSLDGFDGAALGKELVRYATLAPCSHNTQRWKSLGCAAERT